MPIHVPGKRDRKNRKVGASKRSVVAVLSLTAMVDMFTVLAVFLLQNYATTDQILYLPEKVELPQATMVKELKPSNVVIVSRDGIILNDEVVADFLEVKEQEDWVVKSLQERVIRLISEGEEEKRRLGNQIKEAVADARPGLEAEPEVDMFRKMTVQADKTIDFLTIKKIMYTVTESGVYEINFAVMEKKKKTAEVF